ncbi:hypothetical protein ACOSQ2_006960 [Xanthoceras sorbifolium]
MERYNEYAGYVNKVNYGFNNHGGNPSHNGQVEKISSGFEYGKSSLVKDNSLNNRGVRGISGVNNQEGTSRGGSSRFEILEDVMEESEGGSALNQNNLKSDLVGGKGKPNAKGKTKDITFDKRKSTK